MYQGLQQMMPQTLVFFIESLTLGDFPTRL